MPDGEDDKLQMSGIQHFCFCKRQWALIHLEQQWAENWRTAEGEVQHERCHDETLAENRGDLLIRRGMRVVSRRLQLAGNCDVVEFRRCETGIRLRGREGRWQVCPVEYKHGRAKTEDADRLQLCAQAMALEEMLVCRIGRADLFYRETRRREQVELTEELRALTQATAQEMNRYFQRGYTPKVKPGKHCKACSLKELCLPVLCGTISAKAYIQEHLEPNALEEGE